MNAMVWGLALLGLLSFSIACDRNVNERDEEIQRQQDIRSDDLREDDSFDRSVPVKEDPVESDDFDSPDNF